MLNLGHIRGLSSGLPLSPILTTVTMVLFCFVNGINTPTPQLNDYRNQRTGGNLGIFFDERNEKLQKQNVAKHKKSSTE